MTTISKSLLDIIVCPITKGKLEYNSSTQELISKEAGVAYPIKNGIPILLVDEARKLKTNNSNDNNSN